MSALGSANAVEDMNSAKQKHVRPERAAECMRDDHAGALETMDVSLEAGLGSAAWRADIEGMDRGGGGAVKRSVIAAAESQPPSTRVKREASGRSTVRNRCTQ
jgi:hypothetical protein